MDLQNAIESYFECKELLGNAEREKASLSNHYQRILRSNESRGTYSVRAAELAYAAFKELDNHDQRVAAHESELKTAESIIKEYLKILDNKRLEYTSSDHVSYYFYLQDDSIQISTVL